MIGRSVDNVNVQVSVDYEPAERAFARFEAHVWLPGGLCYRDFEGTEVAFEGL